MPTLSKKLFQSCVLIAAATFFAACSVQQDTTEGPDSVMQSADMGLGADHAFRARATIADELGQTHVRYDHFYRGVRVWQGDIVTHKTARGSSTTGAMMRDIHIATTPALTARDAVAVAHQDLQPKGAYARDPKAELVILPQVRERLIAKPMRGPGGELTATDFEQVIDGYTLAYYVQTALENGAAETAHTDYLIDAQSGRIMTKWNALQTAAANGTGNSEYSGVVTIGTNSVGSSWEMRDVARGMNFATYNLNHGTSGQGTIYTDTDNTWGDGADYISGGSTTNANGQTAAVDAHYGVAMTYDYFFNVHGRNGIDGTGGPTYSRVHYSSNYDNAFWDDSCFCMTYGDGSSFNVLTSLDVAGHEMAHGVTSRTANLTYSGESGGLNESMSDIAGTMVEFYARGGGGTTVPATGGNWLIGDQLSATPLRYMYKPSKDGTSPDAWYSGIGSIDVHYSSGPFNRFFYFLSQGASSTAGDYYSSYLPGGMTGIGNDHAARIVFRALTVYMTSSTNYSAARNACLSAATDLYGAASAEYTAVGDAMTAINVGVTLPPPPPVVLQDGVAVGNQSGSTGADTFFKISVPAGQTSLVVTTSGGTGDADLYVKFGSQPTTSSYDCASTGGTTAETCTIANPSTGDYYITVHAYTTYSGMTIVADYSVGGGGGGETVLTDGVGLGSQSGAAGAQAFYKITVPTGQTTLTVTISGGTGDADMYVKFGARPSLTVYDCRPYLGGNAETCTFNNPAAGDWFIMLNGYSAYSGVTILADYSVTTGGDPYLTNGTPVTGISGASGSQQYWRLAVPAGTTSVVFTISGGTGDCDLYVRSGSRPTTTTYNCRPYLSGNTETCTISAPAAGDWYVMLRGYTAYSGVTLKGQY